jgi:hypothetical protein
VQEQLWLAELGRAFHRPIFGLKMLKQFNDLFGRGEVIV